MNQGTFDDNGRIYRKYVNFSKAVLWSQRSISLALWVTSKFKEKGTEIVEFMDEDKNEKWTATVELLRKNATKKKVGQEEQFYFPIGIFTKTKILSDEDFLHNRQAILDLEQSIEDSQ